VGLGGPVGKRECKRGGHACVTGGWGLEGWGGLGRLPVMPCRLGRVAVGKGRRARHNGEAQGGARKRDPPATSHKWGRVGAQQVREAYLRACKEENNRVTRGAVP